MEFIDYADREMLFLSLAHRVAAELGQSLRQTGRASLSVPGGTTPGPFLELLSAVELDWSQVAVVLNDERQVPPDHPRSNGALLQARLLRGPAAAARVIALHDGHATPIEALAEALVPELPLTCLVTGMGEDMHVASLFPDAPDLAAALASNAPPLMEIRAPSAPEPRVTLTAPVLRGALHQHILILGPQKREALERAMTLKPDQAPIRTILDTAIVHWAE